MAQLRRGKESTSRYARGFQLAPAHGEDARFTREGTGDMKRPHVSMALEIRELHPSEGETWLRLRRRLFPRARPEELAREQDEILATPERNAVFVAVSASGDFVGFVEVAIRDWAEGCDTRPVGYIEAWYVEPGHRRQGVGRKLFDAADVWAASRGCTEMGSDAELENDVSQRAHRALGYSEVLRLVCFAKKLGT